MLVTSISSFHTLFSKAFFLIGLKTCRRQNEIILYPVLSFRDYVHLILITMSYYLKFASLRERQREIETKER